MAHMVTSSSAIEPRQEEMLTVRVEQLSKVYRLYKDPSDRLKELLFGRLGRRFSRDFWALRDVSFELARGQRLGVIGRNGSGKSTLLQLLAGTLTATAGHAEIRGRVAALLELGSGFNPEYTGRENVYLNASILGLSREQTDERYDQIVAFADIGQFIEQPVKTYSSGMFVRLAFAVATSVDADVLLIDEALAVGDVFFTQKCFRRLEHLIERGVSIVLVTHDAAAVHQFCDAVLVLDGGQAIFHGETATGVRTYLALQRSGRAAPPSRGAVMSSDRRDGMPLPAAGMPDWPTADAFLALDRPTVLGGGGRCTGIALCDAAGQPCRVFEMGQAADFFFEFTLDENIEAPIGGVELLNERNIVVHGKNSLQHDVAVPDVARTGARLRFRQRMVLNVAQGSYTFTLGLASIDPAGSAHAANLSYPALVSHIRQLVFVGNAGSFSVVPRRHGQALPYHGLCDLDGEAQLWVLNDVDTEPASQALPGDDARAPSLGAPHA
jgi:lipopolysaccharide transport system ATP-binding protein